MRVIHVITGMRKAAGTTTFVENVVEGLRLCGQDVEIAMSPSEIGLCDVMHIHGLWSGLLHEAAAFARQSKIPVVWSTHGMTAPWSMRHKWWKKIPAWWLYQKWDLKGAAAIHCTTEKEVEWNKAMGFKNCFVAPLGTCEEVGGDGVSGERSEKRVLFVGRIYPVKGLLNLVRAWEKVMSKGVVNEGARELKLRIVGPDQAGHKAELGKLIEELGVGNSVEFAGPKFGDELSLEYENCDCLVLPSFTENFGVTVIDAMAHGKPVITSAFTPWREVRDFGCGWWISNEPEQLADAIMQMMSLGDDELHNMGERGRMLVEKKYTWDAVVKKLVDEYKLLTTTH